MDQLIINLSPIRYCNLLVPPFTCFLHIAIMLSNDLSEDLLRRRRKNLIFLFFHKVINLVYFIKVNFLLI